MPTIYIISSFVDKDIVADTTRTLEAIGNTVEYFVLSEQSFFNLSESELNEADALLFYITRSSIELTGYINAITEFVLSIKGDQLLACLVDPELEVPGHMSELDRIEINYSLIEHMAIQIDAAVRKYMDSTKLVPRYPKENRLLSQEEIRDMQKALEILGLFKGAPDGLAGPATRNAIAAFQQKFRLNVNGNPDKSVFRAITKEADRILNIKTKSAGWDAAFWLLHVPGDESYLKSLFEKENGYFNSYPGLDNNRRVYELFRVMKPGDRGIGFAKTGKRGIAFLFEVRKELHKDETGNEVVSFVVTKKFERVIEVGNYFFDNKLSSKLGNNAGLDLFELTEEEYTQLHHITADDSLRDFPVPLFNAPTISPIYADTAHSSIKDQLGFEQDVQALASVIAYKEVSPPLAIGLFGNWGTGKSFFMNKLQQRIDDLTVDSSGLFCKKVLQINFNSWHYSDSNLWASLITKIFEELEDYGKNKPEELAGLMKQLNSTKELLAETTIEKEKLDKQIGILEEQKEILNNEINSKAERLQPLNMGEIWKTVMQDAAVQEDIQTLSETYAFLNIREHEDIDRSMRKLDTGIDRLMASIKMLYSFRKGKSWVALLMAVVVAFTVLYLVKQVDYFKERFEEYKLVITIVSTLISQFLLFIKPGMKLLDNVWKRLGHLKQTVTRLRDEAKAKYQQEQDELNKKITEEKMAAAEMQTQIDLLKVEQKKLESDIEDITSGKKIIRFIESRVTDVRYINSLGIISWVRKDFEQLDTLLRQQNDARKTVADSAAGETIAFELERIILYIDDLDRCNEAIVVKVLEAIHLLLAFPLFVVVVGVDPRWMHRAIDRQYTGLLKQHLLTDSEQITGQPQYGNGQPATSYDYLEKIFQIPFALKPITADGKRKLIKAQLETKETDEPLPPNRPVNPEGRFEMPGSFQSSFATGGQSSFGGTMPVTGNKSDRVTATSQPVKLETLKVTAEEIQFIQDLDFLVGDSPRTIKRYINMYRIIRAHSSFGTDTHEQLKYYMAAIILLGLITGIPEKATQIFQQIRVANDNDVFVLFLDNLISKTGNQTPKLFSFATILKTEHFKNTYAIDSMRLIHLKRNLELVSRFSFREN